MCFYPLPRCILALYSYYVFVVLCGRGLLKFDDSCPNGLSNPYSLSLQANCGKMKSQKTCYWKRTRWIPWTRKLEKLLKRGVLKWHFAFTENQVLKEFPFQRTGQIGPSVTPPISYDDEKKYHWPSTLLSKIVQQQKRPSASIWSKKKYRRMFCKHSCGAA